jgi:hypothetical protein
MCSVCSCCTLWPPPSWSGERYSDGSGIQLFIAPFPATSGAAFARADRRVPTLRFIDGRMPRLGARIRGCPCDVSGGEEIVAVTRGAGDSIHGQPPTRPDCRAWRARAAHSLRARARPTGISTRVVSARATRQGRPRPARLEWTHRPGTPGPRAARSGVARNGPFRREPPIRRTGDVNTIRLPLDRVSRSGGLRRGR